MMEEFEMKILVLNCGSSSLKYQLIDMENEQVLTKGLCERIGIDGSVLTHKVPGKDNYVVETPMPDHSVAVQLVLDALTSAEHGVIKSVDEINAIGHRVLHGGTKFTKSIVVNEDVKAAIRECFDLGPLHNPANLMGIEACEKVCPGKPNVAVFDTTFGMGMDEKSYLYAIPHEYYEKYGIRRYGFHGTSHRYVSARCAELMGKPIEELKLISCHMGNGSSICAIDGGKSVDTSMGFTPLVGLPMGTRCGDLDPGVMQFIMNKYGMNIDEMLNVLNKKSGVLGVSGVSSDFRDLETAADEGNERARLALDMFDYWVAKVVGSYAAAMNGVDAIIFTAGVGENSATTRAGICKYLGYLGCEIDPEPNKKRGEDICISTADSKVKLFVIPTNEELVIARDTRDIVNG